MLIVTPQIDWRRDGLPSSSSLLRGRGSREGGRMGGARRRAGGGGRYGAGESCGRERWGRTGESLIL